MCGICGFYQYETHEPAEARVLEDMLQVMQHRGPDGSGAYFDEDLALGMRRLSIIDLTGGKQPITNEDGSILTVFNGEIYNYRSLQELLRTRGHSLSTRSDTEVIVHLIALSKEQTLPEAMADALRRVEGAFSLVMMSNDRVFAVRDPRGFRPLAMGRIPAVDEHKRGAIVFASETCAFDLIGAEYIRDVKPGELVIVGPEGVSSRFYSTAAPQSSCIFEHVYFSRPDSLVFGRSVQTSREELGRQLAREAGIDADLVVPVPDSGVTAAVGYAAESGLPFRFALIRNHYVGRTFIEPSQSVRDFGVKLKLNPVRSLLEGKRVVLIDDSIVRGTTSRKIVRMIRNAGAKQVHMRISCPPTISPCYYGVDTPSRKQLIAANKSVEEIRDYIGADSLAYLSLEGLKKACGEGDTISYCSACYTGKYPTDIVDVEEILPATARR